MKSHIALTVAIALATSVVSIPAFAGSSVPVTVRPDLMPTCGGDDGGGDPWQDLRTTRNSKSLNLTASARQAITTHAPTGASVAVIGADERAVLWRRH